MAVAASVLLLPFQCPCYAHFSATAAIARDTFLVITASPLLFVHRSRSFRVGPVAPEPLTL